MKTHVLKCWPGFYSAVAGGSKKHELRRNDRDYAVGDVLELHEYDPNTGFTGRTCSVEVTYMTSAKDVCAVSDGALHPDFCILSVQPISNERGRST